MERNVVLGVFLLILPFGAFGAGLHDIWKRGAGDGHHKWGYEEEDGPEKWVSLGYPQCGGNRQSPVDIDPDKADLNPDLNDFDFDNFDKDFKNAEIVNNGHTIQLAISENEAPRTFTEGGMDDTYQFLQLHFHWGDSNKRGSEHTIDGKAYPLEMHMVCMNTNYATKEEAQKHEDGFAVLGVLFKIDDEDNEDFDPIIKALSKVKKEGSRARVGPFDLQSLLPDNTMPYYRYEGSLTTPPCLEIVTWTIFEEFQEISANQLKQFREVTEDDKGEPSEKLVKNFRNIQELNLRGVERSGKSNAGSHLIPSVLAMFAALIFIL